MAAMYTGVVTVTGEGRNGGRVRAEDGLLETGLAIPKELGGSGGATNPEQLMGRTLPVGAFIAAGYDSVQVSEAGAVLTLECA